jgi:predicted dehydrogenase
MQRAHARTTDYFDLWLHYGSTKVILKAGMLVREPGPRYMIHGTLGSFIKYGDDPQEALLKQGILPGTGDWGREPEAMYGLLHTEINGQVVREKYPSLPGNFGAYYADLYESLVHGRPLKVKPEHGYNTIRMIELATESSRTGCRVACRDLMEVSYS